MLILILNFEVLHLRVLVYIALAFSCLVWAMASSKMGQAFYLAFVLKMSSMDYMQRTEGLNELSNRRLQSISSLLTGGSFLIGAVSFIVSGLETGIQAWVNGLVAVFLTLISGWALAIESAASFHNYYMKLEDRLNHSLTECCSSPIFLKHIWFHCPMVTMASVAVYLILLLCLVTWIVMSLIHDAPAMILVIFNTLIAITTFIYGYHKSKHQHRTSCATRLSPSNNARPFEQR